MLFRKVKADNKTNLPAIRWIDNENKWHKIAMNGKFTNSKPMPILKDYGFREIDIIDEGIFGLRATNRILD